MRIDEITNIPQTYIATVRVVLRDGNTTVRTMLTADTYQQARVILTRIYGEGNVVSLNQSMQESPWTSQIDASPTNGASLLSHTDRHRQIDSDHPSCVTEMGTSARVLSPQELQVKALSDKAAQYKQQAKMVKARQQMAKAQQQVTNAFRARSSS